MVVGRRLKGVQALAGRPQTRIGGIACPFFTIEVVQFLSRPVEPPLPLFFALLDPPLMVQRHSCVPYE